MDAQIASPATTTIPVGTAMPTRSANLAYSTRASSTTISARTNVTQGGSHQSVPTRTANMTRALITRFMCLDPCQELIPKSWARTKRDGSRLSGNNRTVDSTVTPLSPLISKKRFEQMATSEIRPEGLCHPNFCVGDLPQQKVADSHLAARPDK